ncbi:MAG: hypothetical protein ACLTYN_01595 [Dysosmobacter welbionis]
MTVSDMLKARYPANDCAVALAETVSAARASVANEPAGRGVGGRYPLCNATGLPAEGHVTSAYDTP